LNFLLGFLLWLIFKPLLLFANSERVKTYQNAAILSYESALMIALINSCFRNEAKFGIPSRSACWRSPANVTCSVNNLVVVIENTSKNLEFRIQLEL
jgi:hypothetical protein